MATPAEKLAKSLEELKKLQNEKGIAIIKANDLSRVHKERLKENGFIKEVIKGWYISSRPDEKDGDTTSWFMSFWSFAAVYLNARFHTDWCLSPEQSLLLLSGNMTVPAQLLVRSPKANNNNVLLLHSTSFFDLKLEIPAIDSRDTIESLQVYSLADGLIACGADFFNRHATDARTCLSMIRDASELLGKLLNGGHSVIAGRLAGAFRNIGNNSIADNIINTMKSVGYDVRENDPFEEVLEISLNTRETSPYANRIKLMWHQMRQAVIDNFPKEKKQPSNIEGYLLEVEEHYTDDAYHSLSIEGYQVTTELIERVRGGNWNPDDNEVDSKERNAMAARGYYQAFQAVKKSIKSILEGEQAGDVADKDHSTWYRELFAPSVTAGLLKPADLAGYRNNQVYIKGSMHTPLNPDAVRDAMPTLFELLKEEEVPGVRAVLGHFIFVYIHPYMDGNGRIGRFLFNTMLASGGYSWAVVPVGQRDAYMAALEKASAGQDITDFARFLGELIEPDIKDDL
ncbi:MAG: Fic family protein [Marinilabiliaceae bacterium]|nr:Fic family protein [Marinilabiliaceae bacterium]